MIDHIELKTRKLVENVAFYRDLLTPLGYELKVNAAAKGFGDDRGLDFFLVDGEPTRDVHYAFVSPDRATVDRIYLIGEAHGYRLDRAPALAPHIHENYYAAYLRDPDDRLVEFVCQLPA